MKDKSIIVRHRTTGFLFLLLIWLVLNSQSALAQSDAAGSTTTPALALLLEWQVYPAGTIPSLRLELSTGVRGAAHLRLGYNVVRHRDLGVHDDERGGGLGFSLGYRHFLRAEHHGWYGGLRSDLWFNTVDWKDNIDQPDELSGTTELLVLQPTLEAGYLFVLNNHWIFSPSIAFGFEKNIVSDGADVGEGAILLLGIQFGKRFGN